MCGVVAALRATEAQMVAATAALSHRGIRQKIEYTKYGAMGHVRLPIVGLQEEYDQPMRVGDKLIGFVGELLDFKEHAPSLECDAPLVADTWSAEGPEGFIKHDGFWGIVALHDRDGLLRVFTDYLGQKPMYYRTDFAAAASEPDALKAFGPLTLDKVYLSACIKWGYCPDIARTPYNEMKRVLPGEYVVLGFNSPRRTIVDVLEPLKTTYTTMAVELELAVKRRVLSSDVTVACLVSGGIDSAIVYTLAKKHGPIVPYFVSEEKHDPEIFRARAVVQGSAFALRECLYRNVTAAEALGIMQEPIDLGSLRPQIALSRAVGERVCLTGDGADELFGGYSRSLRYDSQYTDIFQELPGWHLPRLDRVMMRERIEVRSPFLARNVVRMALALPHSLRRDKKFLRELFHLPGGVSSAPKKALRTPEIEHDREAYSRALVEEFIIAFEVGDHAKDKTAARG